MVEHEGFPKRTVEMIYPQRRTVGEDQIRSWCEDVWADEEHDDGDARPLTFEDQLGFLEDRGLATFKRSKP